MSKATFSKFQRFLGLRYFVVAVVLSVFNPISYSEASTCIELFGELSPKHQIDTNQILAVHLTNKFPESGSLEASPPGRSRVWPTLHFSLGQPVHDHSYGAWSSKKFAVLTPLASLVPQLLNLYAQDTFIFGSLNLPSGATVLVPESLKGQIPSSGLAKVEFYPDSVNIKEAVKTFISNSSTQALSIPKRGPLQFEDPERGDVQTWFPDLMRDPELMSDLHSVSWIGLPDVPVIQAKVGQFLKKDGRPFFNQPLDSESAAMDKPHNLFQSLNLLKKSRNKMEIFCRKRKKLCVDNKIEEYRQLVVRYESLLMLEIATRVRDRKSVFATNFLERWSDKQEIIKFAEKTKGFTQLPENTLTQLANGPYKLEFLWDLRTVSSLQEWTSEQKKDWFKFLETFLDSKALDRIRLTDLILNFGKSKSSIEDYLSQSDLEYNHQDIAKVNSDTDYWLTNLRFRQGLKKEDAQMGLKIISLVNSDQFKERFPSFGEFNPYFDGIIKALSEVAQK